MRAQKLPYKIVDLNRSHRQVEMRFPDEGPTHRQVEMRFPKWSSQNFPTNSLQRTNPVDRSKWGTQVWGPKTYEIAEVPHPTGRNEVPKNYGPKTIIQNRSPEQVPRNEVSKMRTPKICYKNSHKSRPQVETRFRKRWPKIRATKSLPWRSPIHRQVEMRFSKGGLKKLSYKIALSTWTNREGEFFDVPRTRSVATYAADSALVLMHDGEE